MPIRASETKTAGTSDALNEKSLNRTELKKQHFTDETPPAQMGETSRLQQWVVSADLQLSVKAIYSSPEMWKTLCLVRAAKRRRARNQAFQAIVDTLTYRQAA